MFPTLNIYTIASINLMSTRPTAWADNGTSLKMTDRAVNMFFFPHNWEKSNSDSFKMNVGLSNTPDVQPTPMTEKLIEFPPPLFNRPPT